MNYIVVVKQKDVLVPHLYKTTGSAKPIHKQLITMGADIVHRRKDVVTVDRVSDSLWNAISARYLHTGRI